MGLLLLLLPAALCVPLLLLLLLGLRLLLGADCDLALQWAEWWGRSPEQELPGMVVWVTGASSGIGEELAYQLSKLGVSLVLSARREHELERVKRRCLENGKIKERDILILPLDLTDRSSHAGATKAVLQEFGKIDILINNGGRAQNSWIVDTNLDVFKELMEVNYLGTVSLTKCVLPHMMKRKQGKVVTMNSLISITSGPRISGYCTSKCALQGFFNCLYIELCEYPDIIISNIFPGPVESNIIKNALTRKSTQTFGRDTNIISKMTTSRCVSLILIAMANDLKEVWISGRLFLFVAYLRQYMPSFSCWMLRVLIKLTKEKFPDSMVPAHTYRMADCRLCFALSACDRWADCSSLFPRHSARHPCCCASVRGTRLMVPCSSRISKHEWGMLSATSVKTPPT